MPVRAKFVVPGGVHVVVTLREIVRAVHSSFVIHSLPSDLVHFRAKELNVCSDLFSSFTSMLNFETRTKEVKFCSEAEVHVQKAISEIHTGFEDGIAS